MATYDADLVAAARQLLKREPHQRGRLPSARVRRSISTAYYALFHFLLHEAGRVLVGSTSGLHRRRRTFARSLGHSGMKAALDTLRGANVEAKVADLLRPAGVQSGVVATPAFAREMAVAFADAQAKRHDADYDLNQVLSELDASQLIDRVEKAIRAWRAGRTSADRDFKRALCMLMLLDGKLRR